MRCWERRERYSEIDTTDIIFGLVCYVYTTPTPSSGNMLTTGCMLWLLCAGKTCKNHACLTTLNNLQKTKLGEHKKLAVKKYPRICSQRSRYIERRNLFNISQIFTFHIIPFYFLLISSFAENKIEDDWLNSYRHHHYRSRSLPSRRLRTEKR